MARRGRPAVAIILSADERNTLQRWAQRHSSSQALALRSKIVLACARGDAHRDIAAKLGCHPTTVGKWRHRFAVDHVDGLVDAPRPGAARTIGDDVIEAIVVETLETAPPDATHWSTRGLAAKHGISHTTVGAIWRAFGLKPWRQDSFKVSPDPDLVDKIRDIVGLYLNPPVAAAVFAVDQKPQIQALNRTAPTLPPSTRSRLSSRASPSPAARPRRARRRRSSRSRPSGSRRTPPTWPSTATSSSAAGTERSARPSGSGGPSTSFPT